MSAEILALVAGAVLSLALAYIPGLAPRYRALDTVSQRGIMGLLLVLAALVIVLFSCLDALRAILPAGWAVQCSAGGVGEFIKVLLLALAANQGVYGLSPASSWAHKLDAPDQPAGAPQA